MKTQMMNNDKEFELDDKNKDEDRFVHYNANIWYN